MPQFNYDTAMPACDSYGEPRGNGTGTYYHALSDEELEQRKARSRAWLAAWKAMPEQMQADWHALPPHERDATYFMDAEAFVTFMKGMQDDSQLDFGDGQASCHPRLSGRAGLAGGDQGTDERVASAGDDGKERQGEEGGVGRLSRNTIPQRGPQGPRG